MKKFTLVALLALLAFQPCLAHAQNVTKGAVQRNNYDFLTIDGVAIGGAGLTMTELSILDGVTATAAELNYNDVTTLGTLEASKAWSSDASLDTIMPTGGLLTVQSGGAITLNSGSTLTAAGTLATTGSVTATGTVTSTRTTSADSGTTNKAFAIALTAPVDTTGTNSHVGFDFAPTIGNASGGTNSVIGYNVGNVTGDAQVDVTGLKIGTGTTLGTSYAINIGSGWDAGLNTASKTINSYVAGADSGTTNNSSALNLTFPVDTTGTNTHNLVDMALTAANATGGTNTVNGLKFENYTGDAQVNVNAINIGTSDGLGTAVGLAIGTGWDTGISVGSPVTGSGLTTVSNMVGFTRAIQTQQTTLTAAMCGSVVTNSGAVVSTLPEASTVLGCTFNFITGNASNFDVNPADGTDTISLLTNAAGDAVRNATVGNSLCLVAVSNDLWHQCSSPVGTWSDVN